MTIKRRNILIFIAIVFALSFAPEALMIKNGGIKAFGGIGPLVLIWIPGLVA